MQLRRRHRPHADADGRPSAEAVDRHADQGPGEDQRAARRRGALHEGGRPGGRRARAGGDGGRSGTYCVAYRRAARHAARTGAAQKFARGDRDAQGRARIHGRRPVACAGCGHRPAGRGPRTHRPRNLSRSAEQPDSEGRGHRRRRRSRTGRSAPHRAPRQGLPFAHPAARERGNGHPVAQDQLQQRLRLLHRGPQRPQGQGPRDVDTQTDAGQCRALHHRGAQGVRGEDSRRRGEDARSRAAHLCRHHGLHLFVAPADAARRGCRGAHRLPAILRAAGLRAALRTSGARRRQAHRHPFGTPSGHRNADARGGGVRPQRRHARRPAAADHDDYRSQHVG